MRRTFHREVNVQPSPPSGLTVNWQASWIGRRTPAGARVVREIESDHVAWVEPGHWLGQTVSVAGPVTAVSVDVTGDRAVADLELCTPSGDVLAARTLVGGDVPWDRFSEFLQVDPPQPAGTYLVRLTARQGPVGWRSRFAAPSDVADDGVSPLPVVGSALRDGQHEPGVRCLGVETPPAPNPIFRTVVVVDGEVSQARLFAVGLGYGAFSINGHPVTADVLDPAPTDYDRTVLYRTYDVTRLLKAGENVLTAELAPRVLRRPRREHVGVEPRCLASRTGPARAVGVPRCRRRPPRRRVGSDVADRRRPDHQRRPLHGSAARRVP
jgi:alpha-L-rhamnosidase